MAGLVGGQQGGNGSVRNRLEAAERDQAGDEVLVKLPKNQSSLTAQHGFSRSQRDIAEFRRFQQEEAAIPAAVSSTADVYLAAHKREESEKAAKEAADIASGRLVIIDDAYEERRIRAEYAAKARQIAAQELELCYSEMGATAREIKFVNDLVREKHPAQFGNTELHKLTLMKLRQECGVIG
jgi:hypothetical protein